MADTIVKIEDDKSEPDIPLEVSNAIAETTNENDVEIVKCEEDAETEREAIRQNAETERVAIQADAAKEINKDDNEELALCQQNIKTLQESVMSMMQELQSIRNRMDTLEVLPPNPQESPENVGDDRPEVETAPEPQKPKRGTRWI